QLEGEWPAGGAVLGYFGYEAGRGAARLPADKAGTQAFMPEVEVGLYPWTIVVDHERRRAAITSLESTPDADVGRLRETLLAATAAPPASFRVRGPIESTLDREAYLPRARKVLGY